MPVTRCKLRKQSGDARRAEKNVFPNAVNVLVCDIWIVAFDVHLDDGFGTKMFISVSSDTTFANGTEEKMWECHWQEKPVQYLRLDLLQFFARIVDVSDLNRLSDSTMRFWLLSLLERRVIIAPVFSKLPKYSAVYAQAKF